MRESISHSCDSAFLTISSFGFGAKMHNSQQRRVLRWTKQKLLDTQSLTADESTQIGSTKTTRPRTAPILMLRRYSWVIAAVLADHTISGVRFCLVAPLSLTTDLSRNALSSRILGLGFYVTSQYIPSGKQNTKTFVLGQHRPSPNPRPSLLCKWPRPDTET